MRYLITLCCAAIGLSTQAQSTFSNTLQLPFPVVISGSDTAPGGGLILSGRALVNVAWRGTLIRTDVMGQVLWVKVYSALSVNDAGTFALGFPYSRSAYADVLTLPDSSYFVVGHAQGDQTSIGPHLLTTHYDAFGDTLDAGILIDSHSNYYAAAALEPNGTVLCGGRFGGLGTGDGFLNRMDADSLYSSGAMHWSPTGGYGSIASIAPTPDGGAVSAGSSFSTGGTFFLTKADPTLNEEWTHFFINNALSNYNDAAVAVAPDSTIDMMGSTVPVGGGPAPTFLVRTMPDGTILWSEFISLPLGLQATDMIVRPNGNVLLAGTAFQDANYDSAFVWTMQLDPDGALDWAQRYGIMEGPLGAVTMEPAPTGDGYYLVGGSAQNDVLLFKVDTSGMLASCSFPAINPLISPQTLMTDPDWTSFSDSPSALSRYDPVPTTAYASLFYQCTQSGLPYRAEGTIYNDANADGMRDPGEVGLSWYPISIAPATGLAYTNASGDYELITDMADTYTITPALPQQWWAITSDSATYNPTFTATDTLFQDLDFGYDPVLDTTILEGTFGGWVNCNIPFQPEVWVSNVGTTTPQGAVAYTYDLSMQLLNTEPPFDSIAGQTIYWRFDSLWFGGIATFEMEFELIPFTWSIGDTLATELIVFADDGLGNLSVVDQDQISTIITCSYDPNSKTVAQPAFIPVDEDWLTYTVNFQNTGTDTAYTVVIEDQLSQHLQWNTLQFLGASHDLSSLGIGPLGKATFTFNNLLLPDSNVNEAASHGSISYRIRPQAGLPHLTSIENNAGIFFDLNAPVITNTVTNRIINCSAPGWMANIVSFAADELWMGAVPFNDTMTYTMQWYLNGAAISGAIDAQYGSPVSGTYTASMTDEFGCTQFSDPYEVMNVGMSEHEGVGIRVLPNPFTDRTTLIFSEPLDASTRVEFIDVQGRVVRTQQGNGSHQVLIERGDLQAGMYMVRVLRNGERMASTRLVVQ